MTEFELIFETAEISDDQESAIYAEFDAAISQHSGVTLVTVTAQGVSALDASLDAVARIRRLGVSPVRLYEDLVTRATIAERAGVTPQAVGHWIRGERHAAEPFPVPFNVAAGGIWLWGDVNEWLRRTAPNLADTMSYPRQEDYLTVNAELRKQVALTATTTWVTALTLTATNWGQEPNLVGWWGPRAAAFVPARRFATYYAEFPVRSVTIPVRSVTVGASQHEAIHDDVAP